MDIWTSWIFSGTVIMGKIFRNISIKFALREMDTAMDFCLEAMISI